MWAKVDGWNGFSAVVVWLCWKFLSRIAYRQASGMGGNLNHGTDVSIRCDRMDMSIPCPRSDCRNDWMIFAMDELDFVNDSEGLRLGLCMCMCWTLICCVIQDESWCRVWRWIDTIDVDIDWWRLAATQISSDHRFKFKFKFRKWAQVTSNK